RVDATALTPELVYQSGPVILDGGEMVQTESGSYEYHLRFHWEGSGYLYLHLPNTIFINNVPPESESTYRGTLYTLPYSADGIYDICLLFSHRFPSAFHTAFYFGTFSQMNDFVTTAIECNYYIQGLCFSVTLFSFFLFFWKRSERYLFWLALLAFMVSSYRRLEDILGLFTWIPHLSFLTNTYFYRAFTDVIVALLQYNVLRKLIPLQTGHHRPFLLITVASIPSMLLYHYPLLFIVCNSIFFILLYAHYLHCFLKVPESLQLERHIFLLAWLLTSTARLFEHSCESGLLPYGDINLRLRFRGIISVIYVIAFFLVACKRFAQKFQEADDLNVHLEEEILKKSRQQTTFIRSMLHNLKTPLFSLSGYSDMAMKTIDTNPTMAKQYIQRTHEKAIYAGYMMDQIFFVTQMESGLVQFQQVPINLTDILRSVIETSQITADKKQIQLLLKAPEVMTTSGDPLYLQQAFQNIIDNALIHTPEGGQVLVMGVKENNRWRLLFTDSGCGIAPEERSKIFDAYYSNRPDNIHSSGLGLYITKEIVSRHQGTITVESLPGSGTTFVILLSQTEDTASAADGSP
ncbi:MAG: HAMP domain-containing histidine kinase, partial [Lachnospiraceae bacterium]|nr:HAMP domain-containing histidine kinase [Lachnospiraceae bacterium]